ncbi:MAG: two-component regulator propeller domain-containing protein, partial [Pirellulales bacterium]
MATLQAVIGTVVRYDDGNLQSDRALSVHVDANGQVFIGTEGGGLVTFVADGQGGGNRLRVLDGNDVTAIVDVGFPGRLWVLASQQVYRIEYEGSVTSFRFLQTTNYGLPCGTSAHDIVIAPGQERWTVADTSAGEFAIPGICRELQTDLPEITRSVLPSPGIGNIPNDVTVDGDGRIWISIGSRTNESGGLVAHEIVDPDNPVEAGIRREQYNWLNAPVVSDPVSYNGAVWASGFTAVGAADERVWGGQNGGDLVTLAQRWQQLDQSDNLAEKAIEHVWTARGRLFLATADSLHVLMPDGATWDNRVGIRVNVVFADSQGNIWVGTDGDVRLYAPAGWDLLADRVGQRPTTAVRAIAEDQYGRIWIGSDEGLTLFDRNRFVVSLDESNSRLPSAAIHALLVDSHGRLWVGTNDGLSRAELNAGSIGEFEVFKRSSDGAPLNGLASNVIFDLAEPSDQRVAVSTDAGLSYYSFDAGQFIADTAVPLPAGNLPLSVDEQGRLWAGSAVRMAAGWQAYYWANSGLRSSRIADNATDGAGRVWFSHAPDGGVSVRGSYLPPLAEEVLFVDQFTPTHGSAGDTLTISGSGFGSDRDEISVRVGGALVEIDSVQPNSITVILRSHNTSGDVLVTRGNQSQPAPGRFLADPVIEEFTPAGGNVGVLVEIYGTNFDPDAEVKLGSGPWRRADFRSPTKLRMVIEAEDSAGEIQVRNPNASPNRTSSTTDAPFRRIDMSLAVDDVAVNQGIQSISDQYLIAGKPTAISHFLTHDVAPRMVGEPGSPYSDLLEVDTVEVTFTSVATGESRTEIRRLGVGDAPLASGAFLAHPIDAQLGAFHHGLRNGDGVILSTTDSLPPGLQANHLYYVVDATTDEFSVSETQDGFPIPFNDFGTGTHRFTQVKTSLDAADPYGDVPAVTSYDVVTGAIKMDIGNAVTAYTGVTFPEEQGLYTITSRLTRRGRLVAENADTSLRHYFLADQPMRVLLVPIMRNDYTEADLRNMKNNVDSGLEEVHRRIWPTGTTETYWSGEVLTVDDVSALGGSQVDLGNPFSLYDASHDLDRVRRFWNDHATGPDVRVVFGVVQGTAATGR